MAEVIAHSFFTDFDISLFKSGKHFKLYEKFGAHPCTNDGVEGVYFSVFAPSASAVSVVGNFNFWDGETCKLNVRWDESGIWEGFIPGVDHGELYKFRIWSDLIGGYKDKADPYAFYSELKPKTSSITWTMDHQWHDQKWMEQRPARQALDQPFSVYEVHLGSWKKKADGQESLSYMELAKDLVDYVKEMGYTHVEFLPVMEHPFDQSWGYQVTGFFAPTSRFGNPQELMQLIDALHQAEIGVILDWVPAHFPSDDFALARFDGSCVFEHPDVRKGYHPDWKSYIFNYERAEIRSFLISSAFFWLELYHVDALRVDAVSSMIYLDYSREDGEWEPNEFGGNEYQAAISLLQELNVAAYREFPGIQMIAEESTSYTGVSKPVDHGGLGFGMKWMMGWMHDTLDYFSKESVWRKYHQNDLTFSLVYAFSENFMLPLSHDEVVHGKGSIISRMPGDEWQRFSNLRLLYSFMFTHPGTKLNFMGNDFGQYNEWNSTTSLDWHLLEFAPHQGVQQCIKDLNRVYKSEISLHKYSFDGRGFEWIDYSDHDNSIMSFIRKSDDPASTLIVVFNLTPVPREAYDIGAPTEGKWKLIYNSDETQYFGSGYDIIASPETTDQRIHNLDHSLTLRLAPLSCLIYKAE